MGDTVGNQSLLITGSFNASDPTVLEINNLLAQNDQSPQAQQLVTQAFNNFLPTSSTQTIQSLNNVIAVFKEY
jgi:hypothetical protein